MKKKPVITAAMKVYGAKFGNTEIINERPARLRSSDPMEDKELFNQYKRIRRQQTETIKHVLR